VTSASLRDNLPEFIQQRTRIVSDVPDVEGAFVVYWMCTAVRADENPALDAARVAAETLGCPLIVYHGLSSRYPFASDRHHRFILEGARDVERALAAQNIPYLFHLERPDSPPVLKQLASRAALVVTEHLPTPPIRRWIKTLTDATDTPVWCVDTACLVSLESSTKRFSRAFAFRDQLAEERETALRTPYPTLQLSPPKAPDELPVSHLSLQDVSLAQLIATCTIDHTIPPVPDTRGGATAANQRWKRFRDRGLRSYHRKRNDAATAGVSRMSAYLHYGHISPFRVAREAFQVGGAGAEKYLDELLVWRELAYHWCDRVADPGAWEALPGWARDTLSQESEAPRRHTYAWEALARATTHDALWNLAQRSLLHHGELHNNLRMTWGKQIHGWTTSPQQSLRWLIDLNHRYALDGRDPCSYAGLLWCLGLFDRPFKPAKRVFGTVRTRSSAAHANRLDMAKYTEHIGRNEPRQTVAVVGAGLAGLMCARTLHDHRYNVTVFDKGRTPGGRVATRLSRDDANWAFDHGAPYLSAKDRRVLRWLLSWENAGVLKRWDPISFENIGHDENSSDILRFVGTPHNNALGQHLAADLHVYTSTRIERVEHTDEGWNVFTHDEVYGPFDVLVLNLPPAQLASLSRQAADLADLPNATPTHAVMMRFEEPLPLNWDVAKPDHPVLGWVCRETSKPDRPDKAQWIVHSTPEWSEHHVDDPLPDIEAALVDAFQHFTNTRITPTTTQTHRWRYARVGEARTEGSVWDGAFRLGVCGDSFGGGVEGALLSGAHLAGQITSSLADPAPWTESDAPLLSGKNR